MIGCCVICGDPTPEHSNPRRVRKLCDKRACRAARSRESAKVALAAYRAKHNVEGRTEYTCSACGETKPLTSEHWSPDTRDPQTGKVIRWARWCKPCKRERSRVANLTKDQLKRRRASSRANYRVYMERMRREDPLGYAELQRYWAESERRYRAANPEATKAAQRRYREKLRSDRKRYQRHLEMQRIAYRLRQERLGRPLSEIRTRPVHATRQGLPTLPVRPLWDLISEIITTTGQTREQVGEQLGIPSRYFWAWDHNRYATVNYATADYVLTALELNWFDVWTEDEYPEVHERLAA